MGLKVGDKIKCHDKEDMVDTSLALAKDGVETDFDYSDGLHLVVTRIEGENNN